MRDRVAARRRRWTWGAALLALATAAPAIAQDLPQPPDSLSPYLLDPLIVTILRDPIELRRAPSAVSVVQVGPEARMRPTLALNVVLGGVPGVQVDDRGTFGLGRAGPAEEIDSGTGPSKIPT